MIRSVIIIVLAIITTTAWAAKKPCARLLVNDDFMELVNEQARVIAEFSGEFKLKSDLGTPLQGDSAQLESWIGELKSRLAKIRADYYISAERAKSGLEDLKLKIAELSPDLKEGLQLVAFQPTTITPGPQRFMKREVLKALSETTGMDDAFEVEEYLRSTKEKKSVPPVVGPTDLDSGMFGYGEWPPRLKP